VTEVWVLPSRDSQHMTGDGPMQSDAIFEKKVLLEHSHVNLLTYCLRLILHYQGRAE
jgi:hypothetical protein